MGAVRLRPADRGRPGRHGDRRVRRGLHRPEHARPAAAGVQAQLRRKRRRSQRAQQDARRGRAVRLRLDRLLPPDLRDRRHHRQRHGEAGGRLRGHLRRRRRCLHGVGAAVRRDAGRVRHDVRLHASRQPGLHLRRRERPADGRHGPGREQGFPAVPAHPRLRRVRPPGHRHRSRPARLHADLEREPHHRGDRRRRPQGHLRLRRRREPHRRLRGRHHPHTVHSGRRPRPVHLRRQPPHDVDAVTGRLRRAGDGGDGDDVRQHRAGEDADRPERPHHDVHLRPGRRPRRRPDPGDRPGRTPDARHVPEHAAGLGDQGLRQRRRRDDVVHLRPGDPRGEHPDRRRRRPDHLPTTTTGTGRRSPTRSASRPTSSTTTPETSSRRSIPAASRR